MTDDPNNADFYGTWVAAYGATGVDPPPELQRTFSYAKTFDYEDDTDKAAADQMQIDDGYAATSVQVSVTALRNDNPGGTGTLAERVYIDVAVGGAIVHILWDNNARSRSLTGAANIAPPAQGNVAVTIYGRDIDQMTVNVELVCLSTKNATDKWKLQSYEKIANAYQDREQAYEAEMTARRTI